MEPDHIIDGPDGRRIISKPGEPQRVALPMHCVANACDEKEIAILMRFTEASELAKGNLAVSVINGEPRGRYALYAARVGFEQYRDAEVYAYRWIIKVFGQRARTLAEVLARLNGERLTITFEQFGADIANTLNADVALGAAIGSARACAWMLQDAYRDFADFWKAREAAAQSGRALTEEESVRRMRRGTAVRHAINSYSAPAIEGDG
jgi:hypothetical protein